MRQPEQIRKNLLDEIERLTSGGTNKEIFEKWLISQSIDIRKFIYKELDKNTLPTFEGLPADVVIKRFEKHIKKHYEKK